MNEQQIDSVIDALFSSLESLYSGHPWAIMATEAVKNLVKAELPTLLPMITSKLAGK